MYRQNSFGQCRGCGRRIIWIKTKAGKNMPVDTGIYPYRKDPDGKDKIVTENGEIITGTIGVEPDEADGMGYISHFATCQQSKRFKGNRAR